tara:strand:+ start:71 stop:580 length:510 start_codon:yes stop_codon:yes gene_type:complete
MNIKQSNYNIIIFLITIMNLILIDLYLTYNKINSDINIDNQCSNLYKNVNLTNNNILSNIEPLSNIWWAPNYLLNEDTESAMCETKSGPYKYNNNTYESLINMEYNIRKNIILKEKKMFISNLNTTFITSSINGLLIGLITGNIVDAMGGFFIYGIVSIIFTYISNIIK